MATASETTSSVLRLEVAPAEVLLLLSRAATPLFVNGQTTERTTTAVELLARKLGCRATVLLEWGDLRIRIADGAAPATTDGQASPLGVHMGKVAATMDAIAAAPAGAEGAMAVGAALARIEKMGPASLPRFTVMAVAGAVALAVIFGAQDPSSLLLVALSAGTGGLLRRLLAGISVNPFVQPFAAALLAGLIGAVVIDLDLARAQRLVAFCPCMILVPGPHLLNGAIDLLRGRVALGTARTVYAGLIVLAISAGLLVGLALGGASLPAAGESQPAPLVFDILTAGVAVAAYGTYFSMAWRLLPIPMAIGMLAHGARWFAIAVAGWNAALGALIACLIVGTIVTPVAHRMHLPFAAFGFASVVSLIPGVLLFQMAGGLVQMVALGSSAPASLLASVAADGVSAFLIMLAIALGLILPNMAIHRFLPADS